MTSSLPIGRFTALQSQRSSYHVVPLASSRIDWDAAFDTASTTFLYSDKGDDTEIVIHSCHCFLWPSTCRLEIIVTSGGFSVLTSHSDSETNPVSPQLTIAFAQQLTHIL